MTGVSWHRGCPVPLRDLRLLTLTRLGFDGKSAHGQARRPRGRRGRRRLGLSLALRRRLPDPPHAPDRQLRGSDFESIEADNTSAFNCRRATGSGSWSEHAYGRAIDLNPIENPYVEGGRVYHAASKRYANRSKKLAGMIHSGDAVVEAFRASRLGLGRILERRSQGLPALLGVGSIARMRVWTSSSRTRGTF